MPYCNRCDDYYRYYDEHTRNSSSHWICHDCNLDFGTRFGLKEHYVQSPRHDYCQKCDEHLYDEEDLQDHLGRMHEEEYCFRCQRMFKNALGLHEHKRQSAAHDYCAECRREFQSDNNLRAHLNSSVHRPRTVQCPAPRCNQTFVSHSAMVLHLESGHCTSGVNRESVNRFVRSVDKNNYITDSSRLLTYSSSTTFSADSASWNGRSYECYLCHSNYSSLKALNQHLASPRHQDKIYICKLSTCQQRFTTLSALWQHVESEKCGIAKFKVVKDALDNLTSGMRRLAC